MSTMRQKFCDIHGLMFHDDCDDHPEFESFTLGYQAATEAAKATDTAGELPRLPAPTFMWNHEDACGDEIAPPDPYYSADQMRTYGQACADIARHQSSQSLMMETIQRATAESGLTRMEQCCGDPLKYCATDQWKGNLEGFAKALLRLNASVFAGARQPVPVAAQENGGLVRAALIDLMEIEQAATAGEFKQDMTFDFAKQSHYRALFARARAALAATAAPAVANFSISEAQKNVIRRAADALEGLDYEDLAGDLRAVIPFSKGQPEATKPAQDLGAAILATCTCPSGDGSLRWPCPQHPPLPVAITDKTGPNGIKWYVEPNLPDGVNLYIKEQK